MFQLKIHIFVLYCFVRVVAASQTDAPPVDEQPPDRQANPDVRLLLARRIEPFDAKRMLPEQVTEGDVALIEPLGPIRLIRSTDKHNKTRFFAASFQIHTQYYKSPALFCGPTRHLVSYANADKPQVVEQIEYQFDMSRIAFVNDEFVPGRRVIVVIPGYLSGSKCDWMDDIAAAWRKVDPQAFVVNVYWQHGNSGDYEDAVQNTAIVARQITMYLYYLASAHNVDWTSREFRDNVYLVGHSLGAHIAGMVGEEFGGQLGRVTGLDPAGPIFDFLTKSQRLSPDDAQFVDVIHTNAGKMNYLSASYHALKRLTAKLIDKLRSGDNELALSLHENFGSADADAWYGLMHNAGHVDYYANGGSVQPGCNDVAHVCDHGRASEYYRWALEYELWLRSSLDNNKRTLDTRERHLLAFKAATYERFKTGQSLAEHCADFVSVGEFSASSNSDLLAARRKCTVPLDFVTAGGEMRALLVRDYGLELDVAASRINNRYYFDTLAAKPFLAQTFVTRVHVVREDVQWADGCKLKLRLLDNEIKLGPIRTEGVFFNAPLEMSDEFRGFALPMLAPLDFRKVSNFESDAFKEALQHNEFDDYMPDLVLLRKAFVQPAQQQQQQLTEDNKNDTSKLKNALSSLKDWFGSSQKEEPVDPSCMCRLEVYSVELRPIEGKQLDWSAWYSNAHEKPSVRRQSEVVAAEETWSKRARLSFWNDAALRLSDVGCGPDSWRAYEQALSSACASSR